MLVKVFKHDFFRHILTLMTGTVIAQALPVLASPALTRLFSPDEFGVFALFMSVVFIIASFSCGKYELAIMLPKDEKSSFNLLVLAILVCAVLVLLSALPLWFFNAEVAMLLTSPEVGRYLYVAPIAIFLLGCYQSLFYYSSRNKQYRQISLSKVSQAGTMTGINVLFGVLIGGVWTMVVGYIVGQFIGIISLLLKQKASMFAGFRNYFSLKNIAAVAKEYKKFPFFFSFSYGLNTVAGNLTPFILATSFELKYAGYFLIVQRAIASPLGIISRSVADVFFQKASHQTDCRKLYLLTSGGLFAIGVLPTIAIFFYAEPLFGFFFGEEWIDAGKMASILIIMFFLSFATTPVSQFSTIHQKVAYNLAWQILLVCSMLLAWWLGVKEGSVMTYLIYYAFFQSILYLYGYFYEYHLCRKQYQNQGVS